MLVNEMEPYGLLCKVFYWIFLAAMVSFTCSGLHRKRKNFQRQVVYRPNKLFLQLVVLLEESTLMLIYEPLPTFVQFCKLEEQSFLIHQ